MVVLTGVSTMHWPHSLPSPLRTPLLPWTGIDWLRQKELSGLHELIWNQACLLALEQAGRACLCFAVSGLQTGSGKTFTMEGGPGDLAGVSMRTVEALFQLAADRGPDSVFTFKVGALAWWTALQPRWVSLVRCLVLAVDLRTKRGCGMTCRR